MNNSRQDYPNPPTPIDKAWRRMAEMMESEMPVADSNIKKRAFSTSTLQFLISAVAAMVFVGGGVYLTIKQTTKEIPADVNYIKQQNTGTGIADTFQFGDTVSEVNTVTQTCTADTMPDADHFQQPVSDISPHKSVFESDKEKKDPGETPPIEKHAKNELAPDYNNMQLNELTLIEQFAGRVQTMNHTGSSSISEKTLMDKKLLENKNIVKATSKNKKPLLKFNWPEINLSDKPFPPLKKSVKKNKTHDYTDNYHLYFGMSGNNSLMFSKNFKGNIYSYGTLLNIGIQNGKYNFAVETGMGVQFFEHRIPYSRTLYIYQVSGTTDSTITVSSYKYNHRKLVFPLFAEKTVYRYNRFSLDLKAGVNTSVFLSRKRLFNQLPGDIEAVESAYNPSFLNFSLNLTPQFRWNATNKISFSLSPSGTIYLNSLYENYFVKPYGVDFSAGVYYAF